MQQPLSMACVRYCFTNSTFYVHFLLSSDIFYVTGPPTIPRPLAGPLLPLPLPPPPLPPPLHGRLLLRRLRRHLRKRSRCLHRLPHHHRRLLQVWQLTGDLCQSVYPQSGAGRDFCATKMKYSRISIKLSSLCSFWIMFWESLGMPKLSNQYN